jgi:hypothetical protein
MRAANFAAAFERRQIPMLCRRTLKLMAAVYSTRAQTESGRYWFSVHGERGTSLRDRTSQAKRRESIVLI